MNKKLDSFNLQYRKEFGFNLLMIPVSFVLMIFGLLNWDTIFVFMGLLFAWLLIVYIRSLGYMFLVSRKLTIKANEKIIKWYIYDNDVLIKECKIYKKDISSVHIVINYSDGIYNYTTITFEMHIHDTIVLQDNHTFSFASKYKELTDFITSYGYANTFTPQDKPKENSSYILDFYKEKKIGILKDAIKLKYKQTKAILYYLRYIFYTIALYLVLNPLVNYILIKNNIFDGKFIFLQDTSKAIAISPQGLSVKILKDDEYFYTIYKKNTKYYILKQKEFTLGKTYITLYDKIDLNFLYEELKDEKNIKDILKNLSQLVYRQIDTWEYIVKPLYFANDMRSIIWSDTSLYLNELKQKEEVKEYLKNQEAKKQKVYKKMSFVMQQSLEHIYIKVLQNRYGYIYLNDILEEFEINANKFKYDYKKEKKYQDIKKLLQIWKRLHFLQSNLNNKIKKLNPIILDGKKYYYQYEAYMPYITYSQTFLSLVKNYKRVRKDKIILNSKLEAIPVIYSHNTRYDYINIATKYKKMYFLKSHRTKVLEIYNDMYKSNLLYTQLYKEFKIIKNKKY